MNKAELIRMIDHTLLNPEATPGDVKRVCEEAREFGFFSVCVNTHYVPLVASELVDSEIAVCSVAGFPLGAVDSKVKAYEARRVVEEGGDEVDMVLNVGALKAGQIRLVQDDIAGVVEACGGRLVKVIIEAALLSDQEKQKACELAIAAGASFVKTSTGFGPPGATTEDVRLMREAVGTDFGVKASAGIRTASFALDLVEAGANRIGTSTGVRIVEELRSMPS